MIIEIKVFGLFAQKTIQYAQRIEELCMDIIVVKLDAEAEKELSKDINGSGGFQSLLAKLNACYNWETKELTLTQESKQQVEHYCSYPRGGYEDRLKNIMRCIDEQS